MGNTNQELERLQLISDYLKGKLSPKQVEKFDKRLESEPILAEEFYKHKKLLELLKQKQEQNIAALLKPENDTNYMKQERMYRREELRQELEKIKDEKNERNKNWERKIAQSNQPSIFKMAAVFVLAIAIGASVFVMTTQLIDTQNEKASQAEVVVPTLVEVETDPNEILDQTEDNSLFKGRYEEALVQSSNTKTNSDENLDTNKSKKSTSSVLEQENLLAYQPIKELENKLNQNTRSSINLKSPATFVENYDENIVFEWTGKSEEDIYLDIINSKEEIMTYENLENPFVLDQKLEKGIYYWILQTDSEIIQRGKFLVN